MNYTELEDAIGPIDAAKAIWKELPKTTPLSDVVIPGDISDATAQKLERQLINRHVASVIRLDCPNCNGTGSEPDCCSGYEECSVCQGDEEVYVDIPLHFSTIKTIYRTIVQELGKSL